ncbi:MAG: endolytic transglycosylase MltG [Betaproteobacteria bacterium]|nr:MAG: endolytic transglycosylase MltG [Betaproteobacteria bacterium]
MTTRRIALGAVVGVLVAVALAGAWAAHYAFAPLGFSGETRVFEIERGASLRTVARDLTAAGVVPDPWRFEVLGRMLGRQGALKAGSYQLEARWSPLELLDGITGGAALRLDKVVLVEGWTFRQIRTVLDGHESLRHDSASLSDAEVLSRVGMSRQHPEGLFFPDTYHFAKGTSDLAVLRRAALRMQEILAQQWAERHEGLPLSDPYQALILASIIEKETGRESDRPMVAAVLVNRLRKGMRLQVDPTVIYGLGEAFDGNLRRRDLEHDSPYNTYLYAGLPPTPIAVPGLASIAAAVKPAASSALYFVARGDGSSHFSDSLPEHNRAVNRYQRQSAGSR